MGGSHFESIAQELQKQQQRMEAMLAENRELKRQLADLRAGRGIVIEIDGIRFALTTYTEDNQPEVTSTVEVQPQHVTPPAIPETPTVVVATEHTQRASTAPLDQETQPKTPSTFLEQVMIDEFSAAMTSPMAVWNGPFKQQEEPKKQEVTEEEKNAALRRELMGSFLLE